MAVEAKRGCGFRRVGGVYLVASGLGEPCHKLPVTLDVCPCCHGGIKPTRSFTWVGPALVGPACAPDALCCVAQRRHCPRCPVCSPELLGDKAGLLWVGGSFYPTPGHFTEEARTQGISRRIPAVPRGFEAGKHFVLLAHREATVSPEGKKVAGIFHVFRPERVELIVRQSEATPEKIAEEAARGVTVVAVPDGDPDHDPEYKPRKKATRARRVVDSAAPATTAQLGLFEGEVRP